MNNPCQRSLGSVVPRPKEIEHSHGVDYMALDDQNFHVSYGDILSRCDIASRMVSRYTRYFFEDTLVPAKDLLVKIGANLGPIFELKLESSVNHFKCEATPHMSMDETYTISVEPPGGSIKATGLAVIKANTTWGILRGLETFSQLIFRVDQWHGFGIHPVKIKDEPRFQHRGFLLDTARHFISIDKIKTLLDSMSYNKLNVFHWHMVDDQAFPYMSSVYPQLAKLTAYRQTMTYSSSEVKDILEYAAERGIRVMPEFDSPGHTFALRAIPDLLTKCYDESGKPDGTLGPVDPTKVKSYTTIAKLISEFVSIFYDTIFHAGGDEVGFDCWRTNPEITKWMAARNISGDYHALNNFYIERIYDILAYNNRTMLVWQEVFDSGAKLPHDAIIQVWKYINVVPAYMNVMKRVVEAGYRAVLSSCWYLNYIDYGEDWIKFYKCDPTGQQYIDPKYKELVMGGEVCMWSEFVDDSNVVQRTWPRASAAAERLWSPSSVDDVGEFFHRLEQMRCRMTFRGVQAEPVNGPGYC